MSKPKKKYKPGKVVAKVPILVNSYALFGPFEEAVKRVIETGEAEIDEHGIPVYRGASGKPMSYWHTLQLYIRLIELRSEQLGQSFDLSPLKIVLGQLEKLRVLDEEDTEKALNGLVEAQKFIAAIPHNKLLEMTALIRVEFANRHISTT